MRKIESGAAPDGFMSFTDAVKIIARGEKFECVFYARELFNLFLYARRAFGVDVMITAAYVFPKNETLAVRGVGTKFGSAY